MPLVLALLAPTLTSATTNASFENARPVCHGRTTTWFNRCRISSLPEFFSEGDVALPIRDVLRRQRNTRVVLGEVVDIDRGGTGAA